MLVVVEDVEARTVTDVVCQGRFSGGAYECGEDEEGPGSVWLEELGLESEIIALGARCKMATILPVYLTKRKGNILRCDLRY